MGGGEYEVSRGGRVVFVEILCFIRRMSFVIFFFFF